MVTFYEVACTNAGYREMLAKSNDSNENEVRFQEGDVRGPRCNRPVTIAVLLVSATMHHHEESTLVRL